MTNLVDRISVSIIPPECVLPKGVTFEEHGGMKVFAERRPGDGLPTGNWLARLLTEDGRSALIKIQVPPFSAKRKEFVDSISLAVLAGLRELGYADIESPHTDVAPV